MIKNMDDFAKVSGISRPTLSKYFSEPTSVKPATRARIEKALKEHDFRPNIYAMNMNREKTKNIGIVVPIISDPYYAEMIGQLELYCIEAGYRAIIIGSHGRADLEKQAIETLLSLKVAGALIAPIGFKSDVRQLEKLQRMIPLVIFDAPLENLQPFVGSNNHQSASLLTNYLCRSGTPPIFLSMPPVNENALGRRAGYIQAMESLGLEPRFLDYPSSTWDFERVGFEQMTALIQAGNHASKTVFCSSDRLAYGAMAAAFQSGLKVGREADCDIRIAGHDDHPLSQYMNPSLTTVVQDYKSIAARSFEILIHEVDGNSSEASSRREEDVILFDTTLRMRASA